MSSVIQTAQYILSERPLLTTMGLQRLVFFSQCRHYALYGLLLYPEKSYKRHTSPVSYELMALHEKKYLARVEDIGIYAGNLNTQEKQSCDWVLSNFGEMTGENLARLCKEWDLTGNGEAIDLPYCIPLLKRLI